MTIPASVLECYDICQTLKHRPDVVGALCLLADEAIVAAMREAMTYRHAYLRSVAGSAEDARTLAYERHLRAMLRWERRYGRHLLTGGRS